MKKNIIFNCLLILVLAFTAMAQENKKTSSEDEKKEAYKVNPADVSSIDGIIKATYDSISGGKNEKRNWDRFRSLFHPDARLIPTGKNPQTGLIVAGVFSPDGYINRSESFLMQNGFYEKEIARRTESFGHIVHLFSTYEGRYSLSDEKPFLRGINSFQLLNDGKRWWIISIYWQAESPDNPLPDKYLKTIE
jgi:hypothetical protein